ncbi:hypothetical protein AV530_017045 [Patagioenas fasciata monilis]|uniref:Uncharacterized protein n=1 Tax=Patagioenas fasciata monilis TaxID=372326 RepID=A0A1V4J4S6_PATFA|nr:hypothetical protein AV530_017045 [Patagioenas fasciata monilis]
MAAVAVPVRRSPGPLPCPRRPRRHGGSGEKRISRQGDPAAGRFARCPLGETCGQEGRRPGGARGPRDRRESEVTFQSCVIIVPVFTYFQYTGKFPSEQSEHFTVTTHFPISQNQPERQIRKRLPAASPHRFA